MPSPSASRYDPTTIALHWLTAALVFFQFGSAELWDFFPKPDKHVLILSHTSLGVALIAVLLVRIFWRTTGGAHLAVPSPGLLDRAAKILHFLLYALLVVQMPLGVFTRWTDNHPLFVFGLLIPSPLGTCAKTTGHFVDQLHDITAWVMMGLVAVHSLAALVHHYVWHDEVLARMWPGRVRPVGQL
jgi:cytochrome b561